MFVIFFQFCHTLFVMSLSAKVPLFFVVDILSSCSALFAVFVMFFQFCHALFVMSLSAKVPLFVVVDILSSCSALFAVFVMFFQFCHALFVMSMSVKFPVTCSWTFRISTTGEVGSCHWLVFGIKVWFKQLACGVYHVDPCPSIGFILGWA